MNIAKMFLLAATSIVFMLGLAACDKPEFAEKAGESLDDTADKIGDTMQTQSDNAGMVLDDTAITGKVKATVLAEPGLDSLQIHVDTVNGVTTLSGIVDSQQNSDRAEEIASGTGGVTAVNNQLVVKSSQ
jgi:osmotically-inducible protein OsmY